MRKFALVVLASLLPAAADAADLFLAPGEPFTGRGAELLLAEPAAASLGTQDIAFEVSSPVLPLNNPSTKPVHLELADLHTDPLTGRFEASVIVRVEDGPTNLMTLQGRAEPMIEIASLTGPVTAGTVLEPAHVALVKVGMSQAPVDAQGDLDAVIGMEVVRRLGAGHALRPGDTRPPALVRRGEVVTLVFERGKLRLATVGKALEDGGMDQLVRVANLDSRREVRAIVTDRKRARVVEAAIDQ
jgi:flagellar basal body P-ring formation protein FlgA